MSTDMKRTIADELHRPARRNYPRRHVDIRGLDETWQADLVDMSAYSSTNNGHKFLLTVIDIFSKFAWGVAIKSKNAGDVTAAMKSVLARGRVPKHLHVDQGKEFYNKEFKALMTHHGINMYPTFSNLKASICERFNRTLKNKMWKQFTLRGSYKWLDILPKLMESYNNTKHRTIKMKPSNVTASNEKQLYRSVYKPRRIKRSSRRRKFKVGDKVRISKYKNVFEKGYTPNWTTEIFTVTAVNNTDPPTYKLADYLQQGIEGSFYEPEISRARFADGYLVEKVLRKRGDRLYVKWLGFDNSHNSWINKSDM